MWLARRQVVRSPLGVQVAVLIEGVLLVHHAQGEGLHLAGVVEPDQEGLSARHLLDGGGAGRIPAAVIPGVGDAADGHPRLDDPAVGGQGEPETSGDVHRSGVHDHGRGLRRGGRGLRGCGGLHRRRRVGGRVRLAVLAATGGEGEDEHDRRGSGDGSLDDVHVFS